MTAQGDADGLGGHGHGDHAGGFVFEQGANPIGRGQGGSGSDAPDDRGRSYHQQLAQIAVAHPGDAAPPILAAGRVLSGNQAQEGGELPAGPVVCAL